MLQGSLSIHGREIEYNCIPLCSLIQKHNTTKRDHWKQAKHLLHLLQTLTSSWYTLCKSLFRIFHYKLTLLNQPWSVCPNVWPYASTGGKNGGGGSDTEQFQSKHECPLSGHFPNLLTHVKTDGTQWPQPRYWGFLENLSEKHWHTRIKTARFHNCLSQPHLQNAEVDQCGGIAGILYFTLTSSLRGHN